MSDPTTRPITKEEWAQYDWHDVSTYGGEPGCHVRGLLVTRPPDDGYVYVRAPYTPGDTEYKWVRAWTVGPEK